MVRMVRISRRISRRGLYEVIISFFVIIVIVFLVILFMYMDVHSASLYAALQRGANGPKDAIALKDALLACNRIDYIDANLLDAPCPAKGMLRGFRITQYSMNGCEPLAWDFSRGSYSQSVPFVVAVEQPNSSKLCLARLDVLMVGS